MVIKDWKKINGNMVKIKGYISTPKPFFGQFSYYVSKTKNGLGKAISEEMAHKLIKSKMYIVEK